MVYLWLTSEHVNYYLIHTNIRSVVLLLISEKFTENDQQATKRRHIMSR